MLSLPDGLPLWAIRMLIPTVQNFSLSFKHLTSYDDPCWPIAAAKGPKSSDSAYYEGQ